MMYFSRLKTALILGACLLGAVFCLPNLIAAPAAWLPWRTVRLGLDLQGGSYLLMQVDMKAVVKERLNGLLDGVRQALRHASQEKAGGGAPIFYRSLTADLAHDRVVLRLRDPAQIQAALGVLHPLAAIDPTTRVADLDIAAQPDGTITLTLSPVALNARAVAAVQQSIEIVRRRIDETGVVDPQITRQGASRIVVQLPGIERSEPDQAAARQDRAHDLPAGRRAAPTPGAPPPPGWRSCRCRTIRSRRSRSTTGSTSTAAT